MKRVSSVGHVIYVLKDKRSDEIRYVGTTGAMVIGWSGDGDARHPDLADDLRRTRLQQHVHSSKDRRSEKARWLLDILAHVEIQPIGIARRSDVHNGLALEKYWIGVFDAAGHRLLNSAKDLRGARQGRAS